MSGMRCLDYYEEAERRIAALGVTAEQMEAMKEYGLLANDNVTGFHEGRFGNARYSTLLRVISHVEQTGVEAYYVEMDVRNLGGLNGAVGHTEANRFYAEIASVVRTELSPVATEAIFFRHGGDEMSAFLIGTTEVTLRAAFWSAHWLVEGLALENGFHNIPHPKHRGEKRYSGVGVRFGFSRVTAGHEKDPTAVFTAADTELERGKVIDIFGDGLTADLAVGFALTAPGCGCRTRLGPSPPPPLLSKQPP